MADPVRYRPRPAAGKGCLLWAGSQWLAIGDGGEVRLPRPWLAIHRPEHDSTIGLILLAIFLTP